MKLRKIYFILYFFVISCSSGSIKESYLTLKKPILLNEKKIEFIPEGRYYLFNIAGDFLTAVTDSVNQKYLIHVYNLLSKKKNSSFGQFGNADLEYQFPMPVIAMNDHSNIYISDPNKLNINRYNPVTKEISTYIKLDKAYLGSRNIVIYEEKKHIGVVGKMIHRYIEPNLYFRQKALLSKKSWYRSDDSLKLIAPPLILSSKINQDKFLNILTENSTFYNSSQNTVVCAMRYFNNIFLYKNNKLLKNISLNNLRVQTKTIVDEKGKFFENSVIYFEEGASDEKNVYLILKNRRFSDENKSNVEKTHLLVFDWSLNLRNHFLIDNNIQSIKLDGKGNLIALKRQHNETAYFVELSP